MFRPIFRPLCTITARAFKNTKDGTVKMQLEFEEGSTLHKRFGRILSYEPNLTQSTPAPESGVSGTIVGKIADVLPIKAKDETETSAQFEVNELKINNFITKWFPDHLHLNGQTFIVPTKYSDSNHAAHRQIMEHCKTNTGIPCLILKRGDADPKKVDAVAAPVVTKKLGFKKE